MGGAAPGCRACEEGQREAKEKNNPRTKPRAGRKEKKSPKKAMLSAPALPGGAVRASPTPSQGGSQGRGGKAGAGLQRRSDPPWGSPLLIWAGIAAAAAARTPCHKCTAASLARGSIPEPQRREKAAWCAWIRAQAERRGRAQPAWCHRIPTALPEPSPPALSLRLGNGKRDAWLCSDPPGSCMSQPLVCPEKTLHNLFCCSIFSI
ncbi:PREDICTED: uncharacterized protein LOC101810787 [Ficedula albicollis]|uniref:uncharacterized protein LOC101810787 n=1 Tax=Ficedula albicollis TaxID=59894 RepID=UPI0003592A82|nr:PREDICTED: uncharacterized protein LOC101810787 [Ficedula albicollis]